MSLGDPKRVPFSSPPSGDGVHFFFVRSALLPSERSSFSLRDLVRNSLSPALANAPEKGTLPAESIALSLRTRDFSFNPRLPPIESYFSLLSRVGSTFSIFFPAKEQLFLCFSTGRSQVPSSRPAGDCSYLHT